MVIFGGPASKLPTQQPKQSVVFSLLARRSKADTTIPENKFQDIMLESDIQRSSSEAKRSGVTTR